MTTEQELVDFASDNGVLIHPRIDNIGGPSAWVDEIEAAGGVCPAASRQCPCTEAIGELANPSPGDQHCAGYFYVTQGYMAEIDPNGKIYGKISAAPSVAPTSGDDDVDEVIGEYMVGIKEARKLFDEGDYEGAFDKFVELAEGTDCGVCKSKFEPAAVHVNSVRNMCNLPHEGACDEERKRVAGYLTKMNEFFSRARGGEPKAPNSKSEYITNMKSWMKSDDVAEAAQNASPDFSQKTKFYMASQLASGKASTVDDALNLARDAHGEWF